MPNNLKKTKQKQKNDDLDSIGDLREINDIELVESNNTETNVNTNSDNIGNNVNLAINEVVSMASNETLTKNILDYLFQRWKHFILIIKSNRNEKIRKFQQDRIQKQKNKYNKIIETRSNQSLSDASDTNSDD